MGDVNLVIFIGGVSMQFFTQLAGHNQDHAGPQFGLQAEIAVLVFVGLFLMLAKWMQVRKH